MNPSTEGQDAPQETLRQIRRALEDLVLFEGRQFIMPRDLPPQAEVAVTVPTAEAPDPEADHDAVPEAAVPATEGPATEEPVEVSPDEIAEEATRAASLDEFRQQICDCTRCELGHTRTHFVFGAGHPQADLLFVGEAPGADEDRLGEPFVGAAGQLLTKIIEAMGLSRDEVFICNVLKCRPPNNRDPLPEEVASCEPYLKEQIRWVAPRVICCLGKFASQALLRSQSSLGRLRGQQHEYEGIPLIVTYHPAALLRNAGYKRDTWEDVKWVRRLLDGVEL